MRDLSISITSSFLLAVALAIRLTASLIGLALSWAELQAARIAVALSRLHSAAWLKRREDERWERVRGSWP